MNNVLPFTTLDRAASASRRADYFNWIAFSICSVLLALAPCCASSDVLQLHPENPHYFLFRGKPTILITSGEHYGAVLNLDFDYSKYLQTLAGHGFNLTRTFTGAAYCEPEGAFNITMNSLAPKKGRFISPWARSTQAGAWDGGNKWDLTKWNDDYFKRFRDFVAEASKQGVVVEVNLFCPFYENDKSKQSSMWPLSPFHAANNINGLGAISSHDVYTLDKSGGLLPIQDAFVRKIVNECKDFDNVYYEICNEPYFAGVTLEWQHHIADVIADAQTSHATKKLIAQNIANHSARVKAPHPSVSIFNFHYTYPPVAVAENAALNKVIGENETGFRGNADEVYRIEAWDFVLAGGGLFNNLDYSFVAGHEDGSFAYPKNTPGGGGKTFRVQLESLAKFMNSLNFVAMKPSNGIVRDLLKDTSIQLLANEGKEYAAYLHRTKPETPEVSFSLIVPAATYQIEWIDPASGTLLASETRKHDVGALILKSPAYSHDIALRITARN